MNRNDVMRWVGGYERAWRNGDLDAVAELFTEDAHYRPSPYEEAEIGHAGSVRSAWTTKARPSPCKRSQSRSRTATRWYA